MPATTITNECLGEFFISNGKGKPAEKFDNNFLYSGTSFYEVLKVKEKIPLFLEDHLERLTISLRESNTGVAPPLHLIIENIELLIDLNPSVYEGNIRLILHFPAKLHDGSHIYVYYIPHRYPSTEERAHGVPLVMIKAERKHVHSKIIDLDFRRTVNQKIINANAWDALLVDSKGFITEGSKSNFFLIIENNILTPPEKDVLPGITRKHIFELCYRTGIEIKEEKIASGRLESSASCFISGTSPGLLAVRNIGPLFFNAGNPLLEKLTHEYELLVHQYISNKKRI